MFKTDKAMFYDFNKHKRLAVKSEAVAMDEMVRKYRQRRVAGQRYFARKLGAKVSRLPIRFQRTIFLAALVIGVGYCIHLILPNASRYKVGQSLFGISISHETIQPATPSPKQQAFEQYLDSLERAFVADSIFQSQQTIENHAENSIHP